MGTCQQRNECWDSNSIYYSLGLFRCPGTNVSEGPGRFKLNGTTVSSAQEGHKFGNQTSPDYVVYQWLFFPTKQFPCSLGSLELAFQIVAIYASDNVLNRPSYSALVVGFCFLFFSSADNQEIIRK